MMKSNRIIVPEKVFKERVDTVIAESLNQKSRSNLKTRICELKINGLDAKLSKKVSAGDEIVFKLDNMPEINIKPEKIKLDIIFENKDVFVINKPAGMVVHPAAGNYTGTMAQGLMYLLERQQTGFQRDDERPGIVHRLDKDTSGIIIAAKNIETLEFLSSQFKERKTSKTYLAVVNGKLPRKHGEIETLIGRDPFNRKKMTWKTKKGKQAISCYRVLKEWDNKSFVALDLKTGRTHQLRVHMQSMGTPIVGDAIYSRSVVDCHMLLHAYRLQIILPGETQPREFRAPLPARFKDYLLKL